MKEKIKGLRVVVEDIVRHKNVANLKVNQDIIEMLQNENNEIKILMDST